MTTPAGAWVAAHAEQPPHALRERLDAMLNAESAEPAMPVSPALFEAGRTLLSDILVHGSTQRAAALDLLTADALVTYAFEAAADEPALLGARAAAAMRAIAALVDARTF